MSTKNKFNSNILPLTLDEKYFGYLLEDSNKSEYLNKIINNLQNNILLINNEDNKSLFNREINLNKNKNNNYNNNSKDLPLQLNNEKLQIDFLKEVKDCVTDKFKVYLSKKK